MHFPLSCGVMPQRTVWIFYIGLYHSFKKSIKAIDLCDFTMYNSIEKCEKYI